MRNAGLDKAVAIHRPVAAVSRSRPIHRFYAKLSAALQKAGIDTIESNGAATNIAPNDGLLHICYHTHITAPNVINVKVGYLPDFFYFDDQGYSGWSAACGDAYGFAAPAHAAIARHRALVKRYVEGRVTKNAQPSNPVPAGLSDYVLVLPQVQGDTVLDLARFPSGQMISTVLRAAERHNRPAVVKFHPRCKDTRFRAVIAAAAERHGATIVDAHIHDLLARASLVAVVNSGTGFEALLHLRTVLTFGTCDYEAAAHPIVDLDQVDTIVSTYPQSRIAADRIIAFLDRYLSRRQISTLDDAFDRKVVAMVRNKAATGTIGEVPL